MRSPAHPAAPQSRGSVVLGVVGGSGLYQMEALRNPQVVEVQTPFGKPSGPYTIGELARGDGRPPVRAVFLPRHGLGHALLPSEINYRANVHGFKQLGVTHLVSVSAVGSLHQDVAPGHIVFPDQFIDRTKHRATSFFGDGAAGHVQFGEPTSAPLRALGVAAARRAGVTVHDGGTCVVMEGPAFSTRAESNLYRSWGATLIGMTALPEAKLAREAEIAYCLLALSTDYDCWHEVEAEVSVESVIQILRANVAAAQRIVAELAASLPESTDALPYPRACENALITSPDHLTPQVRERLDLIIGHYLPAPTIKAHV